MVNAGERRSALLESVLGASPREFESRILRHADLRIPDGCRSPVIAARRVRSNVGSFRSSRRVLRAARTGLVGACGEVASAASQDRADLLDGFLGVGHDRLVGVHQAQPQDRGERAAADRDGAVVGRGAARLPDEDIHLTGPAHSSLTLGHSTPLVARRKPGGTEQGMSRAGRARPIRNREADQLFRWRGRNAVALECRAGADRSGRPSPSTNPGRWRLMYSETEIRPFRVDMPDEAITDLR